MPVTRAIREHGPGPCFSHSALLYRTVDEYREAVLAFIERGLSAGGRVIVVVPTERLELLRGELAGQTQAVELVDMTTLGANPARLIPSFTQLLSMSGAGRVWFVGEPVWAGRSEEEIEEALLHEALCNLAFRNSALTGLCPYDAATLDPAVIAGAIATHPLLADGAGAGHNPHYMTTPDWHSQVPPLPRPPQHARRLPFALRQLHAVRSLVEQEAQAAGLDAQRRSDLVLAVNELASNSIKHAGGCGELCLWQTRDRLVCQIEDSGHIEESLPGRVHPHSDQPGGRGLWLANQLADLMQLRTCGDRTVVRLQMRR